MRSVCAVYASQCILILGKHRLPQCILVHLCTGDFSEFNWYHRISWIDSNEYHCITHKMYNANSAIYLQIEWRRHSIDLYCFIWLLDAYIIHHHTFLSFLLMCPNLKWIEYIIKKKNKKYKTFFSS